MNIHESGAFNTISINEATHESPNSTTASVGGRQIYIDAKNEIFNNKHQAPEGGSADWKPYDTNDRNTHWTAQAKEMKESEPLSSNFYCNKQTV